MTFQEALEQVREYVIYPLHPNPTAPYIHSQEGQWIAAFAEQIEANRKAIEELRQHVGIGTLKRRTKEETRAYLEQELAKPPGDKLKALIGAFGGMDAFVDFFHNAEAGT